MLANQTVEPDWMDHALCRRLAQEGIDMMVIFFPTGPGRASYEEARTICNACPVRAECLSWELDQESIGAHGAGMGMFGGLTPRERQKILRERRLFKRKGYTK